jgi:hypothetical protein
LPEEGHPDVQRLTLWHHQARANGAIIAIPEMADYELRRGLLLTGATDGIRRLDALLAERRFYIPISTDAMPKAAELWADPRRKVFPPACCLLPTAYFSCRWSSPA